MPCLLTAPRPPEPCVQTAPPRYHLELPPPQLPSPGPRAAASSPVHSPRRAPLSLIQPHLPLLRYQIRQLEHAMNLSSRCIVEERSGGAAHDLLQRVPVQWVCGKIQVEVLLGWSTPASLVDRQGRIQVEAPGCTGHRVKINLFVKQLFFTMCARRKTSYFAPRYHRAPLSSIV